MKITVLQTSALMSSTSHGEHLLKLEADTNKLNALLTKLGSQDQDERHGFMPG